MPWVILALLTAFFESGKDIFGKQGLRRADAIVVAWSWRFFALPFLLPMLLFIEIPTLDNQFWWALGISGGLNVLTAVLYIQAIKRTDLSLVVPMITFTPLFLLFTSPLLLGEKPGPAAIAGILLVVGGSYLLNLPQRKKGLLEPFRALVREPGSRLMLLVAIIWSVSANVDKIGLQHSSPWFWAVAVNLAITLGLFPLAARRLVRNREGWSGSLGPLVGIGFCGGLTTLCQMSAISLALVPNVIAIKRTSAVMTVLWGHFLFGETGLKNRLPGACIMVAGTILITF